MKQFASAVVYTLLSVALSAVTAGVARARSLDDVKALLTAAQADFTEHRLPDAIAKAEEALSILTEAEGQTSDARAGGYGAYAWRLIAFAREEGNDITGAIAAYDAYLGRYPGEPAEKRAEATASRDGLRRLGFVDARPSQVEAVVTIDGQPPRRDAQGRLVVSAGEHVVAAAFGGKTRERAVVVRPGELVVVPLDLAAPAPAEPSTWRTTAAWVSAGTGVAALATGVIALVVAADKRQTIEDARGPDGRIDGDVLSQSEVFELDRDASTFEGIGVAGLVVGGVAAVAATVFFVWSEDGGAAAGLAPIERGAAIWGAARF